MEAPKLDEQKLIETVMDKKELMGEKKQQDEKELPDKREVEFGRRRTLF